MFVASGPFPAVANNVANGRHSHFGCVGQARRIVPLTEATHRLGQRSHAPLGTGADVSRSGILFARNICDRGQMAEIRDRKEGGAKQGCQRSESSSWKSKSGKALRSESEDRDQMTEVSGLNLMISE